MMMVMISRNTTNLK